MSIQDKPKSINRPIVALASGLGPSAIAILRMSGQNCHSLLLARLRFKKDSVTPETIQPNKLYLCDFFPSEAGEGDPSLDELMVCFFKGKSSFTGEDSAELFCHGSRFVIEKILQCLFACGFQEALPGEFSKRAYMNGKMDLTAVEGLRALIEAQSHGQWLAAKQLMQGKLAKKISILRASLIDALAYLEAKIDFPDEGETAHLQLSQVYEKVQHTYEHLMNLLSTYQSGKVASQGLKVVLAGPTNAGKSTLLNRLLANERAIVSDIAGTTRDYIEEPCLLKGRMIRLFDTAGLRSTSDPVEKIGIATSQSLTKDADIILLLFAADSTLEEREECKNFLQAVDEKNVHSLLTKADLGIPKWANGMFSIASEDNASIERLKDFLISLVDKHVGNIFEQEFITSIRHVNALKLAQNALDRFFLSYKQNAYDECLAFELQEAIKALKSIIGEVYNEDILDKIFSEFCVGK